MSPVPPWELLRELWRRPQPAPRPWGGSWLSDRPRPQTRTTRSTTRCAASCLAERCGFPQCSNPQCSRCGFPQCSRCGFPQGLGACSNVLLHAAKQCTPMQHLQQPWKLCSWNMLNDFAKCEKIQDWLRSTTESLFLGIIIWWDTLGKIENSNIVWRTHGEWHNTVTHHKHKRWHIRGRMKSKLLLTEGPKTVSCMKNLMGRCHLLIAELAALKSNDRFENLASLEIDQNMKFQNENPNCQIGALPNHARWRNWNWIQTFGTGLRKIGSNFIWIWNFDIALCNGFKIFCCVWLLSCRKQNRQPNSNNVKDAKQHSKMHAKHKQKTRQSTEHHVEH